MAGERVGHSLQATALVNEAYVRLGDGKTVAWHDRAHFLAVSARVMRRILVDHARARHYQKRGGHAAKVTFDEALVEMRWLGIAVGLRMFQLPVSLSTVVSGWST